MTDTARLRVALEQDIISELDRGQGRGERFAVYLQRKELALGTLFAQLSAQDARVLRDRLAAAAPDDPIAARFARLVVDRRQRLLTILSM